MVNYITITGNHTNSGIRELTYTVNIEPVNKVKTNIYAVMRYILH